jgi:DNA polymerase I-like protein with 3'-5' exonuclease and polymerase domains
MKKGLIILEQELQALGLKNSDQSDDPDYEFVANIHDEWQIESKPEYAETIGQKAKAAIVAAGAHFKFACPLDGNYSIGQTWADTH